MTTDRKQGSQSKVLAQQTARGSGTSTTMATSKRFGCTDNIMLLTISGSFVGLLGLVLLIMYLVARGLTSSLYLVEGMVPSYAVAAMLMLTGLCVTLLIRFRYVVLNSFALLLCLGTLTLCLVSVITTAVFSIPFLESFSACILRVSSAQCQCYILAEMENSTNTGIVIPGVDSKTYTFFGARTCYNVENTLKDFLYAMCVIYGFAALACVFSGTLSMLSLCSYRRYTKKLNDDLTVSTSTRGRRTSQNSGSHQPLNSHPTQLDSPAVVSIEAGSDAQRRTSHNQRSSSSNRQPNRNQVQGSRGQQVQRSASMNQDTPSPPRQVSRSNSTTAANVQSRSGQRRPPLIRGGFLQSHVNGPSIPVYTVPGSNEAYIALTDLPSLQMSTMDEVPAYVSEIQYEFPVEEPPPYTPSADANHVFPPPLFTPVLEIADVMENNNSPPDVENSTMPSHPLPESNVTVAIVQQMLGSSGNSSRLETQELDRNITNNLNQDNTQSQDSPQSVVPTISGNSQMLSNYSLPPSVANAQLNSDRICGQAQSATQSVPVVVSSSQADSQTRSRGNSPNRYDSRQEPSLSISQNVARTQSQNGQNFIDHLVTGARPKNGSYANQLSIGGERQQHRLEEQHCVNIEPLVGKKKRSKSPTKSGEVKLKQKSRSATDKSLKLPNIAVDNSLLPESEITPSKKSNMKTEHQSRSENRHAERKHLQSGSSNQKQKSRSPDKKPNKDPRSKSPSKFKQKHKLKNRTKGVKPIRLNIPVDMTSSSDEETMEGLMNLVKSVHVTRGQRSRDQKHVKGKDKKNLSDSKV